MARKHFAVPLSLLLAVAGAATAALPGDAAAPEIQRRHAQLQHLHDSMRGTGEPARGEALAAKFRQLYADAAEPGALRASGEASLHMRFDDAMLADFYRTDPYAFAAMQASLGELERRGAATPEELRRMRNALLAAKRFDEAAHFVVAHPDAGLAPVPRFVDAGGNASGPRSAWRDAGDGRFERVALDLGPTQVLVLAGCHFSEDAAREIAADPVLGPAFRAHATWLGMPPGSEDPADVVEWNRAHPQAPMLTLYDRADWPMFPIWRMPSFYVLRDGKVLGSVVGWKPAGARDELIALLRENWLLPAGSAQPMPAPSAAAQGAASSSQ
jgi:hypothetical protein